MSCGTIFGSGAQYIKVSGGDFIAIEGSNTVERLTVSDLRMPYKQLLKSKIILKAGQQNYLFNFLGIGDNATFIVVKAIYNKESVIEEDNYITWCFFDDMTKTYPMAQMMCLTGNSTNRIKQMYFTNPNSKYAVTLEVMVAIIDDSTSFFVNTTDNTAVTYTNISIESIKTLVLGESIQIIDTTDGLPFIYFNITDIDYIQRTGNIVQVNTLTYGLIILIHSNELEAAQTESLLTMVINNPTLDIDTIGRDNILPVIYFTNIVSYFGSTSSVVDTTMSSTFSAGLTFSGPSMSKTDLIDSLITNVIDDRDGIISTISNNIIIESGQSTLQYISATGSYFIKFDIKDIALNNLDSISLNLTIS
jgi:hypothetical protein